MEARRKGETDVVKQVAAIYDIHGNAPALRSVLREIQQSHVDVTLVGGDVAWGPHPWKVIEALMVLPNVHFIRGNADREVAGRYGIEQGLDEWTGEVTKWCANQLSHEQLTWLGSLPETCSLTVDGLGEVLFVHGSPRSDSEAMGMNASDQELAPMLDGVSQSVVVCGHTHFQFDRRACGKRIVNPGSVGLPREARGACWALLGPDVNLRLTQYDYEEAAEEVRQAGAPIGERFARYLLSLSG